MKGSSRNPVAEAAGYDAAALSTRNKRAWDGLYSQVESPVWGRTPIGFLDEFVQDIEIPASRGFRILDAGTGEGRNLEKLLSTGAQVSACDASIHGLRKIITGKWSSRLTSCLQCDLSQLPLATAVFDFVLLADVIETLPDANSVLREVARVLKPKGFLLCNIPDLEDDISADEMTPLGSSRFLYRGTFFYQFLDSIESAQLLERNGFKILRNELRGWTEEAHQGFRSYRHTHTSRIFLVTKGQKE